MKKEQSLVKLNPVIIEQFSNGEEMMLIKAGASGKLGSLLEKLADAINLINCTCNKSNCGGCTNNGCS